MQIFIQFKPDTTTLNEPHSITLTSNLIRYKGMVLAEMAFITTDEQQYNIIKNSLYHKKSQYINEFIGTILRCEITDSTYTEPK